MTRNDSVRLVADSARDTMRHAAELVAPYAETAKDAAVHYAHEANERLTPKVSHAAQQASRQARTAYDTHLHPRMVAARGHVPPNVDRAATQAVHQTRRMARQAADYTQPKLENAIAAGRPVAEEALLRSAAVTAAALAALRGQMSAQEVKKLVRHHERLQRRNRMLKGVVVAGVLAGAGYLAWRWWDQQSNPDWLVEPPAATELSSRDEAQATFDDELAAKEREAGETDEE